MKTITAMMIITTPAACIVSMHPIPDSATTPGATIRISTILSGVRAGAWAGTAGMDGM